MSVIGERPKRGELSVDRFGRHDADDQPKVVAAHLALNLALPTEAAGARQLSLPDRELTWIRRLYEKGVAGFYDVALSPDGWRVDAGKRIDWQIQHKSLGIDKILPSMRTDIVLDHYDSEQRIVIDTKSNSVVTRGWYREETLRSGYIYQIYVYLRSQEGNGDYCRDYLAENASGLLLHPSVGEMVNEAVVIQNHEYDLPLLSLGRRLKTFGNSFYMFWGRLILVDSASDYSLTKLPETSLVAWSSFSPLSKFAAVTRKPCENCLIAELEKPLPVNRTGTTPIVFDDVPPPPSTPPYP